MAIKVKAILVKKTKNFLKYDVKRGSNDEDIFGTFYLPLEEGKKPKKELLVKIKSKED
jgi:hypothetical protein